MLITLVMNGRRQPFFGEELCSLRQFSEVIAKSLHGERPREVKFNFIN